MEHSSSNSSGEEMKFDQTKEKRAGTETNATGSSENSALKQLLADRDKEIKELRSQV